MDYENELIEFNLWYSTNYPKLVSYAKRNRIPEDTVNDSYLKMVEKIQKSGFENNTYMTYNKLIITNLHINNLKKNKYHHVDVTDINFLKTIEQTLLTNDEDMKDSVQYTEDLMSISKLLFKYLEVSPQNYNDEDKFVFRSYFLAPGRFTYRKLREMTNINKNKLTKIITTIKKDLRENFVSYMKKENVHE